MAKEKGILLFYDWREAFNALPPKDCKAILMDMYAMAMEGVVPDTDKYKGNAKIVAGFVIPTLQRYMAVSEKRSASGKAGMASRWGTEKSSGESQSSDNKKITKENFATKSRITKNNYRTEQNNTEQNNTTLPPNPPQGGQGESARDELFERFWEKYPKKVKRAEAEEAWKAIAPDEALLECMLSAITTQKADEGWRREGGRYIPLPANWLRNRRWEDVPVAQTSPAAEQSGTFDTDDFFLAALKRTYGEEVPKW